MASLRFRIAARTDAAGKYAPDAPLEGNEDNMFIDNDLSNEQQGAFTADEVVSLSEKGCLMVVADGMGGMNAGEVASEIAIKTVMAYFSHDRLTDEVTKDAKSRIKYMEEVVVAADMAIKEDANANKEHEGMGSTIIMAWLCDGEVCLTWCGDSRAYLYRPTVGLRQVSKDHSYVQDLIDEGKITEVKAFDHPYNNIITRSLGDPEKRAKPDSHSFKVYKDDIFMLCSDGLSGVLRDRKTFVEGQRIDTENLEDIIRENTSSMAQCRDALFEAAERNEWYDNVTVVLCEITEGTIQPDDIRPDVIPDVSSIHEANTNNGSHTWRIIAIVAALVLLILACVFGFKKMKSDYPQEEPSETVAELVEEQESVEEEMEISQVQEGGQNQLQQFQTEKTIKLDTLNSFVVDTLLFQYNGTFMNRESISVPAGFQLCAVYNDGYEEISENSIKFEPHKVYYLLSTKNETTPQWLENTINRKNVCVCVKNGENITIKTIAGILRNLKKSTQYFIIEEKRTE